MRVFVMRHGQTNYNLLGLCNGDPRKDVHLTDAGIRQAQRAAAELRQVPLDTIFTSELPRTRQTAQVINQHHQLEIRSHPLLNDIRSGFEDRPVTEYQAAIAADRLHSKFNDGESLLEHKQRVIEFIHWLEQQSCATALIVAHEETLRVIAAYFENLPDETMIDLHFKNCQLMEYSLP